MTGEEYRVCPVILLPVCTEVFCSFTLWVPNTPCLLSLVKVRLILLHQNTYNEHTIDFSHIFQAQQQKSKADFTR